jgi:hypothetical protein
MYNRDNKGYHWFFLDANAAWRNTLLITLAIIILGILSFVFYGRISTDLSPDSLAGYTYAIIAFIAMILATVLYTRTRAKRQRRIGQLNKSLHWHVSLGVIAIVFVFLHSFGNFNPRTGTYALYGIIALVISGIVGRTIDRLAPRAITIQVDKALTPQGEDRIEAIEDNVRGLVNHTIQEPHSLPIPATQSRGAYGGHASFNPNSQVGSTLPSSWDIAYISLAETPQEVQNLPHYRFVPDHKSPLNDPKALIPGLNDHVGEIEDVQQAMKREQFYRALIRYWRMFHVFLVVVTIGLTLWHLEYAAQLIIPVLLHH